MLDCQFDFVLGDCTQLINVASFEDFAVSCCNFLVRGKYVGMVEL